MRRNERINGKDKLNKRSTNRNTRDVRKSGKHVDSKSSNIRNLERKSRNTRNRVRNQYIEDDEEENDGRVKVGRNGKPLKTKAEFMRKVKRIFFLILFITIAILIFYTISLFKWYGIMKNVMRCENSMILDASGNVIAVIGENRIQENVDYNRVPDNLKNAYISIEDKNYKKHMGISVRRTGGAILAYVTHRGSSYGGSTITQQVVKNVTGENETKITRKIVEWDRAIKTEILFSKDDIMRTYLNVIYVGPNIYGVQMGSRYYFDKDVSDLSLAECAFMAGLAHSPNSYNPFNKSDNTDRIKNRTVTVLDVMLQEGYINQEDHDKAVLETNTGLNFKQGKLSAKGDGVYSYMADATINEVIQDLSKEKKISTSFATNYLVLGGLKIHSTQNSDIQKILENEAAKKQYSIKSSTSKDATSQAAMIVVDQKSRTGCWLCGRIRKERYFKRI